MSDDVHDQRKTLFPDPEWLALWTTAALALFVPQRGAAGLTPMLEVHHVKPSGGRSLAVIVLDIEGFNDWETRRTLMQEMGRTWALERWQVLALRFGAEAWVRVLREANSASRAGRPVATDDEKREIVLVQGMTQDGRVALARADLWRDKRGRIRATAPWQVEHMGDVDAPRLQSNLLDAAWHEYLRTMAELRRAGAW
jgi:hypothetical protein